MTNAQVLNGLGHDIETMLTEAYGRKPIFITIVHVEGDGMNHYISNGNRMDVIKSLREMATALEIKQN